MLKLEVRELDLENYTLEEEIEKLREEVAEFNTVTAYLKYFESYGASEEINEDELLSLLLDNALEEASDIIQAVVGVLDKLGIKGQLEYYFNNKHREKMDYRPRDKGELENE